MMFGSTSPSYLILQSLDNANKFLKDYPAQLKQTLLLADKLKQTLKSRGFTLCGNEPLKLTVYAKPFGYTGNQMAELLRKNNIEPEFADPDYLVLMLSCALDKNAFLRIEEAFNQILPKAPMLEQAPCFKKAKKVLERDHFGLKTVKERITEMLAALMLPVFLPVRPSKLAVSLAFAFSASSSMALM